MIRMYINAAFLAFCLLFSLGCSKVQKHVKDYYPEVRTVSATVQPDGSVLVKGEVLQEGADPVSFLGFCMDTLPVPGMLSGQQLTDTIRDRVFQTRYKDLKPFTRYYFRAFAANANGYAYGNPVVIENVIIDPFIIPCKPAADSIYVTGSLRKDRERTYGTPGIRQTDGWEVKAYYNSYVLTFAFDNYPIQGEYELTDASYPVDRYVQVMLSGPMTFGTVLDGGTKLYIKPIDADHFELSMCDAVLSFGDNYKISTRFICKKEE